MRFALLMLAVLVGCSPPPEASGTVVYLVRHTEAADDGTRDPGLSARGQERAERLSARLSPLGVDAIFATTFRRTQLTAAPLAEASGVEPVVLPVTWEGVSAYIADVEARVRALPAGSVVVVVGHSNTTPHAAGAFTGAQMEDLNHDQYDRLFVVTLAGDGPGELNATTY